MMIYLVGEPKFDIPRRDHFFAPASQTALFQDVLFEHGDMGTVAHNMRMEYVAIVYALVSQMGIDVRLICTDQRTIDIKAVTALHRGLGCKLAGLPGFSAQVARYPRDFCTILPNKVLLVNPNSTKLINHTKSGWQLIESPFGEGGRILLAAETALTVSRILFDDDGNRKSRAISDDDTQPIKDAKVQLGLLPPFVSQRYGWSGITDKLSYNEHLDRVSCLLVGSDACLHLLVDPKIETINWLGKNAQLPWTVRTTNDTRDLLQQVCEPLHITVHTPETTTVPYALNLIQFPDGRVLMTNGDQHVERIVKQIVGDDQVFKTEIPIRLFPVWANAGIRCLINEMPEILMKPR